MPASLHFTYYVSQNAVIPFNTKLLTGDLLALSINKVSHGMCFYCNRVQNAFINSKPLCAAEISRSIFVCINFVPNEKFAMLPMVEDIFQILPFPMVFKCNKRNFVFAWDVATVDGYFKLKFISNYRFQMITELFCCYDKVRLFEFCFTRVKSSPFDVSPHKNPWK